MSILSPWSRACTQAPALLRSIGCCGVIREPSRSITIYAPSTRAESSAWSATSPARWTAPRYAWHTAV
jgi:hypothetical protein